MPGDFDPQKESAAVQGAVARVQQRQGTIGATPSELPLFRTNDAGELVDRTGRVIRAPLPPLKLPAKLISPG